MRKTKIIATLGPSSWEEDIIRRLVEEGVDGFRFNFSHAQYDIFSKVASLINSLEYSYRLPIIGDLQGPVVRLGDLEPLTVKRGETVYFIYGEKGSSDAREVPIPNKLVFEIIREGDEILLESGRLAFRVTSVKKGKVVTEALVDGVIKSRKTLAIRGKDLPLSPLTEKDVYDIRFAVKNGFDAIALSFVKSGDDIQRLREILYDLDAEEMKIIAKIETKSAVENIDDIIEKADIILVARGDLAIYYRLEEIYRIQHYIVEKARSKGKPTIIATQLLESMIENPVPTRSEVVDVITAVKMGSDALLLAGETAAGKYPLEAVRWLVRIINEAEREENGFSDLEPENLSETIAKGVVVLSHIIGGKILAYSEKGNTARRLAKFRPTNGAYVFTSNVKTSRYMSLLRGIYPVFVEGLDKTSPRLFNILLKYAFDKDVVGIGDFVIFTAGRRRGTTDVITVEKVKLHTDVEHYEA